MRRSTVGWATLVVLIVTTAACAHLLGLGETTKAFPHRAHVIEGIACVTCHIDMDEAGDTGPLHLPGTKQCMGCHTEPHDTRPCLECHSSPVAQGRAMANREHLNFEHRKHLGRNLGQCVRCHSGVAHEGESLAVPMAVCLGCHEDGFTVSKCDQCHVDLHTEGAMPSEHIVHDMDWLGRHGLQASSSAELCSTCHRERFCANCHGTTVPALPSRIAFDTPQRQSLHRAGFRSRHPDEARTQAGLCTTCHAERFCVDCHTENGIHAVADGSKTPHPAAWFGQHGAEARRDPTICASCHGGRGEQLCVGCHRVGSAGGSIHPPGWSSRKSASDTPCRQCHVR